MRMQSNHRTLLICRRHNQRLCCYCRRHRAGVHDEQHAGTSQTTSGGVPPQSHTKMSSSKSGLAAMAQISAGMDPVRAMLPSSKLSSVRMFPSSDGMVPLMPTLPDKSTFRALGKRPSSTGMGPVKKLLAILSSCRLVRKPSSMGMVPLNRFALRSRFVISTAKPNSGGMPPVRKFVPTFRSFKKGSVTNSIGNPSTKPLLFKWIVSVVNG
jgi:hypothetical protein